MRPTSAGRSRSDLPRSDRSRSVSQAADRRDRRLSTTSSRRSPQSTALAPVWPSLLSMGCLCGSLLLLASWLFQPASPDRRRSQSPGNQPFSVLVSSTLPNLPNLPDSLAPVMQWLQPKTETETAAIVRQTYDAVAAEPWNLAGVPLELQREILDRGQKEPQLLALANWYKARDRLSQQVLPAPASVQPRRRWAGLTRALGFPQTQVSVTLTAASDSVAGVAAESSASAPSARSAPDLAQTTDSTASGSAASNSAASSASDPARDPASDSANDLANSEATRYLKALAEVELRLQQEMIAHQTWNQARVAAMAAVAQGEVMPPTLASWEAAAVQWQESIAWLEQVPPESLWGSLAADRQVTYRNNLRIARYAAAELKPNPLKNAAQTQKIGTRTTLSVCQMAGDCRSLRGDTAIVRPASLSKIPIALALTLELNSKKTPLNTRIAVNFGNNTEDGGEVRGGQTYTLEALLRNMLANSSNVASNQLIDYLGWETLNKRLKDQGYNTSRVTFKFVGEQMMPSQPGTQANVLTAQELTDMVRDLYTGDYAGRRVVLEALGDQIDRDLAYTAFQGTAAQWIGEKTGRTSETTGTTVIFGLEGQIYVLSVIDQSGLSDVQIQALLRAVVDEIVADPAF
ncbi:MAG: serine hydrolase [Prochlorothrix sp.]